MIGALRILVPVAVLAVATVPALTWVGSASERLEATAPGNAGGDVAASGDVATAAPADEEYCSPSLKKILRRVLLSCGLLGEGEGGRGCQPVEARNVATMKGSDFNALFLPMKERGGIIQFDLDKAELDPQDIEVLDEIFTDQRGASYFFVVARASPEGSVKYNRDLSKKRAEAVMDHLQEKFQDPDLEKEVGLLWLGEEYAQLGEDFCDWRRSDPGDACEPQDINRSAFVAWIDCTL